jgi:hypothetical protein
MIVGPGDLGPYSEDVYSGYGDIKNSIRRFYEAEKGDIILLRIGTGQLLAVGELADDQPLCLDVFGDVDGWTLQHTRRVRWFENTKFDFPMTTFGTRARTFAGVNSEAVHRWLNALIIGPKATKRPLANLPVAGKCLDITELARRLFIEGLGSEYVDRLTTKLASIQRVAAWYKNDSKKPENRPSESETISYLVIPLLFSLGWSEQTCAIEWKHVDVALFDRMPSSDSNLSCVVEVKRFEKSVFKPTDQARNYAIQAGRESCKRLIVTDGIRYVFHQFNGEDFKRVAYLNILEMRDTYEIFECGGAVESILGMAR